MRWAITVYVPHTLTKTESKRVFAAIVCDCHGDIFEEIYRKVM